MSLRIKAKIYQYTRIYLAHEEEIEYIYKTLPKALDTYLAQVKDNVSNDDWLDFETIVKLHVGMWQVEHGFYSKFFTFSSAWYDRLANVICLPFLQLETDIRNLVRKLRGKCETRD